MSSRPGPGALEENFKKDPKKETPKSYTQPQNEFNNAAYIQRLQGEFNEFCKVSHQYRLMIQR